MHEYEIFVEEINPCGGEKHSKKTLIEAEAVSPEACKTIIEYINQKKQENC